MLRMINKIPCSNTTHHFLNNSCNIIVGSNCLREQVHYFCAIHPDYMNSKVKLGYQAVSRSLACRFAIQKFSSRLLIKFEMHRAEAEIFSWAVKPAPQRANP